MASAKSTSVQTKKTKAAKPQKKTAAKTKSTKMKTADKETSKSPAYAEEKLKKVAKSKLASSMSGAEDNHGLHKPQQEGESSLKVTADEEALKKAAAMPTEKEDQVEEEARVATAKLARSEDDASEETDEDPSEPKMVSAKNTKSGKSVPPPEPGIGEVLSVAAKKVNGGTTKAKKKSEPRSDSKSRSSRPTAAQEGESALRSKEALSAARDAIHSARVALTSAREAILAAKEAMKQTGHDKGIPEKSMIHELSGTFKMLVAGVRKAAITHTTR